MLFCGFGLWFHLTQGLTVNSTKGSEILIKRFLKTKLFIEDQFPSWYRWGWYKECTPDESLADRWVNRAEPSKRLPPLPSIYPPTLTLQSCPVPRLFSLFWPKPPLPKTFPCVLLQQHHWTKGGFVHSFVTTGLQSISESKIWLDKVGSSEFWSTSSCCSRMIQRSSVRFLTMTNAPKWLILS